MLNSLPAGILPWENHVLHVDPARGALLEDSRVLFAGVGGTCKGLGGQNIQGFHATCGVL